MIRLVMKNLIKSNLTGKEILSSDQSRLIEIAKLAYSPLGKAFEKQTKIIEEQRKNKLKLQKFQIQKKQKKQITIEGFFPKEMRYDEKWNK